MSISLILFIIAGILVLLDLILGFAQNRSAWFLTPVAVLLTIIGLLITGGGISA